MKESSMKKKNAYTLEKSEDQILVFHESQESHKQEKLVQTLKSNYTQRERERVQWVGS